MKNIIAIYKLWLFCQTTLKEPIRWSKYVKYKRNGKSARFNGIRRQNVADHSLSKLLSYACLLEELKNLFQEDVDFDVLFICIFFHDFGEPKPKKKKQRQFDVLANKKVAKDDVEEYKRFKKLIERCGLEISLKRKIIKAFLLQFSLTSYEAFHWYPQKLMREARECQKMKNTAILFQIIEKWEYLFYAVEHKEKHPTILSDVITLNEPKVDSWINMYPLKYREPLRNIFVN